MANAADFIKAVTNVYKNHGVYVWGGNGELLTKSMNSIPAMETSSDNTARVFRYIALCYDKGFNMKNSRICDCSGLVVYALREIGAIKQTDDYRAKDLQKMSTAVRLSELKPGDLVFNKTSNASHVGIYDGKMVIEAQGRDYGITRRELSEGSWNIGGRLELF